MRLIGGFFCDLAEVGDVDTGVSYSVGPTGAVWRYESPGRVQGIGFLSECQTMLESLWEACDSLYWEELTRPMGSPEVAPALPIHIADLLGRASVR